MFSRGRVLIIGVLIFGGGFFIPFAISFIANVISGGGGAGGGGTLSRMIAIGGFVSIFIGLPLVIISMFLKPAKRKRTPEQGE